MNADRPHIQGGNTLSRIFLSILTLLLATIVLFLMVVDPRHARQFVITALWMEAALPVLFRRRAEGHVITSPANLYPFAYALFCTSPVVLHAIGGSDSYGILMNAGYDGFLRLALIGLVGFQLGNFVYSTRKLISRRLPLVGFSKTQRSVLRVGCVVATLLVFAVGAMSGTFVRLFVGGYGKQQMQYGLQYYMGLATLFLFSAAFSQLMADDLLAYRRLTWSTLFLGIPYLALNVLGGGRSVPLSIIAVGLVMWDLRAGSGHRHGNAAIVLLVVLLVFASSILVSIRGNSAQGAGTTPNLQYGQPRTVAVASALTSLLQDFQAPVFTAVWTINSVPHDFDYLYGKTWVSLVVPTFISKRWDSSTKSASLVFHQEYMPLVTDNAYGYTIMGDGYLNFGYAGTFVLMAIMGYMLGRLERLASSSASPFLLGVYGIFYYQCVWALRADVTALVKGVLFTIVAAWLLVFVFPDLVQRNHTANPCVARRIEQGNRE